MSINTLIGSIACSGVSNIFNFDDVTEILSMKCFDGVEFDLKSIPSVLVKTYQNN